MNEENAEVIKGSQLPTEEERMQFLKELKEWQKMHPILRPGQKKVRSRMTHLIPKKKKRKK